MEQMLTRVVRPLQQAVATIETLHKENILRGIFGEPDDCTTCGGRGTIPIGAHPEGTRNMEIETTCPECGPEIDR